MPSSQSLTEINDVIVGVANKEKIKKSRQAQKARNEITVAVVDKERLRLLTNKVANQVWAGATAAHSLTLAAPRLKEERQLR